MLKVKGMDSIDGFILAEGVGLGKTFETMLYCWVQNTIVVAGIDMQKSHSPNAKPNVRNRHLAAGTKMEPQQENARCPTQHEWGVQCPCVDHSLSAKLYERINYGPVLVVVPPKLIPQWKKEFDETFDTSFPQAKTLKMHMFIEHHEHLKESVQQMASEEIKMLLKSEGHTNNRTRVIILTASNKSIQTRIAKAQTFTSADPMQSFWSAFFWDEFHETRNPQSIPCQYFSQQANLRPEAGTYPTMIGLSATPIVKTVKDIACIILPMEDTVWEESGNALYFSRLANIELLGKRYSELLKESEALRESTVEGERRLTSDEKRREQQNRQSYCEDLNKALLPIMAFRKSTDLWFGKPLVDLGKIEIADIMVETPDEYLAAIQEIASKAKERADNVWSLKKAKWEKDNRRYPLPPRNDTSLKDDATFTQVRFCASFPAYGKVLDAAQKQGEEVPLLAAYIKEHGLYTSTATEVLDSTWYGKYFSNLTRGSEKLERLSTFVDEMKSRSVVDSRPEKMIIGCSGPPVVVMLRLVSSYIH